MPGTLDNKTQPWKAHWPPTNSPQNTEEYSYPEAKKGEKMVLDGRARAVMFKESDDSAMAKKLIK